MTVEMKQVVGSHAIVSQGYDASSQVLYLRFLNAKTVTEIRGVDPVTYREFLAAKSKGKFFHERLK
jgi:hypothetical protein